MPTTPAQPLVYSISDLTRLIKRELETAFHELWVEGEISNFALPRSGHCYFTLKDEHSQLRAVMFKSAYQRVPFQLEDGLKILARGSLSVYEPRGDYQLILTSAEPRGAGALQLAFEQLKRRLAAEGLFAAEYKQPLPRFPKKIGIVTSPTGAAIRDILQIITRRFANVHLLLAPVRVQGAEAPGEIVQAIELFNRLSDVDVLIVGRGGGSLEDLWAFNDERVARALFVSRIPVISAVGHEVDFTIADFVADVRAPTPSAAAELVVQNKADVAYTVQMFTDRLQQALARFLADQQDAVSRARTRLLDPRKRLIEWQQRLDELQHRLLTAWRHELKVKQGALALAAGKLHSLSPLALLARGYAVCRTADTLQIVKSPQQVNIGDQVLVRVATGELQCEVTATHDL